MNFPLPTGICRPVCRPSRETPRYSTIPSVVRMAVAAVKRGADGCELSREVSKAVGCKACSEEIAELLALEKEILLAKKSLDDALLDLRNDLGIPGGNPQEDAWYRALLTRFRQLFRWLFILADVARVIDSAEDVTRVLERLLIAQRHLVECARGGEE